MGNLPVRYVLASASPRRRELMEQAGFVFEVVPAAGAEDKAAESPEELVRRLSLQKAREVEKRLLAPTARGWAVDRNAVEKKLRAETQKIVVIGADTVVSLEGEIFGKPTDREDAKRMLAALSGRAHEVYTGVSLVLIDPEAEAGCCRREIVFAERTEVMFETLTREEIEDWVATGEADDKAGAYAVQGRFAVHIRGLRGDFYNVMGLPIAALYRTLKGNGFLS